MVCCAASSDSSAFGAPLAARFAIDGNVDFDHGAGGKSSEFGNHA
jgi:hypothetical protein